MANEEKRLASAAKQIEIKIKAGLIEKGLTQKELAAELKIKPSKINAAIHGSTDPRSVEIRKELYKILEI